MVNNYKISHFLSNFIACLSLLNAAKQARDPSGILPFHREPGIDFTAFRLIDLGITDEKQIIELPNTRRSVKAQDFLNDVNELEYWLNQRGLTLRRRFPSADREAVDGRAVAGV